MSKNSHKKFVDDIRINPKETGNTDSTVLESNEEELMRELEKKFDELFGSLDDDDD